MDWERASKLLGESLDGRAVKTRMGGGGKQLSYIDHFDTALHAGKDQHL